MVPLHDDERRAVTRAGASFGPRRVSPRLTRPALLGVAAVLCHAFCSRPPAAPMASIRIAVPSEAGSLDPHLENKLSSFSLLSNVYEPLVTTDEDMRIQPCLAERWESPDPLTWILHLRPSVTFHGGRPLTARDVVYSIDRLLRDPELEMRSYLLDVADVRAVDERTVILRTIRPQTILLSKLTFVLVVPEGSTPATLAATADGTGPFVLAEWRPGERALLRRHEAYWGRKPELREAEFALGRTTEDLVQGLRDRRYQLVQGESRKVAAAVLEGGPYTLFRRSSLFVKYLGYDLSRQVTPFCPVTPNPFRDRRVRQAIHLALDRRQLVLRLSSDAEPATQPVPRFIFGYVPGLPDPMPDPARARALLREAGLPGGFDVTLHTRRLFAEAATLIREELAPVGIRVEVRAVPDAEFFDLLGRRAISFWLSRWGDPTGDAADFLEMYVHSADRLRRFGQQNYGGYSNAAIDRAIEESAGIESVEERRAAVQGIIQSLMEEQVLVPVYIDQDVYALDRSFAWRPRSDSLIRAAQIGVRR